MNTTWKPRRIWVVTGNTVGVDGEQRHRHGKPVSGLSRSRDLAADPSSSSMSSSIFFFWSSGELRV